MTTTEMEQTFLRKWRALPFDKQRELLDLVDFLQQQAARRGPRHSLLGLCADLQVDISSEEIAAARKEMWGNFPKDIYCAREQTALFVMT